MLAFQAIEQRCFLAADIGARAPAQVEIEVEAAAANVVAQIAGGSGFRHGPVQDGSGLGVFITQVDEAADCPCRIGRNDHAFDDRVGVEIEDHPIFEAAGLALVRVADDGFGVTVGFGHGLPFDAGGKARTASAGQAALADVLNDVYGRHFGQHAFQAAIAAGGAVARNCRPARRADFGKDTLFDPAGIGRRQQGRTGFQFRDRPADQHFVAAQDGYRIVTAPGAGHGRSAVTGQLGQNLVAPALTANRTGADPRRFLGAVGVPGKVMVEGHSAVQIGQGNAQRPGGGAQGGIRKMAIPVMQRMEDGQQRSRFIAPAVDNFRIGKHNGSGS